MLKAELSSIVSVIATLRRAFDNFEFDSLSKSKASDLFSQGFAGNNQTLAQILTQVRRRQEYLSDACA